MTLDLKTSLYKPFLKPNNVISYVHTDSNHPPIVFENVPKGMNERLNLLSANEEIVRAAAPPYHEALDQSGYKFKLSFKKVNLEEEKSKRVRSKNILWYNPPFNKSVNNKHW